ncbi:MAG: ATP phosphoribosyltransferase regulatory subunit [Candidatus Shikimatogenerans sp. JK-2022]|nr:ATP phosphoribosyltransferase regulatory subunit [Candidatus Shikimatogenerans bostrichidophilus]
MINNIKGTIDLYNKKYKIIKYIINIIKYQLKLLGYTPIKTPSIEYKKILNNNVNFNNKIIYNINNNKFLIFDLTIPLIRFLLKNYNNIIFPFRRYQIQKVWRGEKPQKNRYREFYQLDIDIITFKRDNKYFLELELINLCDVIFYKLNIDVILLINDKNILYGLSNLFKININKREKFFIYIDKINKLGIYKIINILIKKKILLKKYKKKILNIFNINKKYNNNKKLKYFKKIFKNISIGLIGIKNLYNLFKLINKIKFINIKIKINFFLSRGLNYYNKIIFEIISNKNKNISLLGGGRYDNYIKLNNKNTYYIGMSFGIYRLYNLVKNNTNIFGPKMIKVLFINLYYNYIYIYKYRYILNRYKIINEIYPYYDKIKKQIKYSIKKKIYFLIFLGKKEIKNNIIKLKNLKIKKEYKFKNIKKLIIYLKNNYK